MSEVELEYANYLANHLRTAFSFSDWYSASYGGFGESTEDAPEPSVKGVTEALGKVLAEKLG